MAVRLHMKLGVVAEQDRLTDSPDTVVVVEPSVGSVARSKGHLYLLVTSQVGGNRAREATRLAAETIRNEYYYDESAGIRVCLEKAISLANKRLAHQRDRLGLHGDDGAGPLGVGVAVVRGNELYVATVGPAEAYLIRQARLSTLPDPHRDRGLPTGELEPDVWRGELSVGDSLVLVSPNVVAKIGTDELKDAMVTLHPQSAMEHLHHRFVAIDGSGSDGAIAFEATEVASTHKQRSLVPVRPAEPLAGAPDRGPIPLADSVTEGVAAMQAGARQARAAAGTGLSRALWRIQDLMPRRRPAYRKVTPLASRRETQRRAAVALLAFVVVVGGLGTGVWWFGGRPRAGEAISSVTAGQRAIELARAEIAEVWGDGVDLVKDDPRKAREHLEKAFGQLETAQSAGVAKGTVEPLRKRVVEGLDKIFGVTPVGQATVHDFAGTDPPTNLTALVLGPQGMPFVIDGASKSVVRVDLKTNQATAVFVAGKSAKGAAGEPRFVVLGGPDLLILDSNNVVWRWRPTNREGKGTLAKVRVSGATSWGDDVRAIGTFLRNADLGLYNLYVVDPSERQILAYTPARDGGGFPQGPSGRLPTARAVDAVTDLYIDGDIFMVEDGSIVRAIPATDWTATPPDDELLRPAPRIVDVTAGTDRRTGVLYAFDTANDRVIAYEKDSGDYVRQYRLAGGDPGWTDMRGMYVIEGIENQPGTLWWIDGATLLTSVLDEVPDVPPPSPSPSPDASPSPSP
jgi:hypothetical protein